MLFFAVPAVLKILIAFGVILLVSRFVPLYVGLFVGSLTIGLWMGIDAYKVLLAILYEITSGPCLWLALMVGLILVLSDLLARSGQLDRIVATFQNISPGPRFTLVAMPALIGLLPMPGGALFSAPMVDRAIGKAEMKPELKVVVNYWFRHVWEYWWPLYPGVILAVSLFGVPTWQWAIALSPLSLGALLGGFLFIMPYVPPIVVVRDTISRPAIRSFLSEIMPITLLMILIFGIQGLVTEIGSSWHALAKWPPQLSFSLALAITIGAVTCRNSLSLGDFKSACLNRAGLPMVMIVFGAMAFKGCLIESGAIEQVRSELAACHIPIWAVVALLPFIAAFVTGIAVAFVGTSLPLVVSLIPEGQSPFAFAALAYGFGFLGMMLSPIHICLLVTNEYFCTDPMAGYPFMWKPAVVCLAWTLALFIAYKVILG